MGPTERLRVLALALCLALPAACAPDEAAGTPDGGAPDDASVTDLGYADIRVDHGPRPHDVTDEEILYPGYACEEDEACSTGLCYGTATAQGAFEPARCQLTCLAPNDFRYYCDSHADCCSGRCCLDCGPKRGLCTLSPPVLPQ